MQSVSAFKTSPYKRRRDIGVAEQILGGKGHIFSGFIMEHLFHDWQIGHYYY
jgi:hypothetical protein